MLPCGRILPLLMALWDGRGWPNHGNSQTFGGIGHGPQLPAADATCAGVMGINPHRVEYLAKSERFLGPIHEANIIQVGEPIATVRGNFKLLENIPAHKRLLM
jgi:uncharacterized protein (DUF362 family)